MNEYTLPGKWEYICRLLSFYQGFPSDFPIKTEKPAFLRNDRIRAFKGKYQNHVYQSCKDRSLLSVHFMQCGQFMSAADGIVLQSCHKCKHHSVELRKHRDYNHLIDFISKIGAVTPCRILLEHEDTPLTAHEKMEVMLKTQSNKEIFENIQYLCLELS